MFWIFFNNSSPQGNHHKKRFPKIKIGDILYSVHEHLYYDKSIKDAPFFEYIVVKGEAVRFIKGGYTQVVIHAEVDHVLEVYFYKISGLEKSFFRKYEDAVRAAIRATEEYERVWGWCDGKLRRSWENSDSQ